MPYIIGVDEAGYGPNLGPLVVSATLWQVGDDLTTENLYEVLANVVSPRPLSDDKGKLAIADSKALYKPGGGLANLERGVLAALLTTGQIDATEMSWQTLWRVLDSRDRGLGDSIPWYDGYDAQIPRDLDPVDLQSLSERFQAGLHGRGVQLHTLHSAVVFPSEFNDLIDRHGSKGTALSHITLELVKRTLENTDHQPVQILCDKHGGRNKYGPLLQEAFPDDLIEVRVESRPESVYRWGPSERRTEIRFTAKGERFLPAALASMTSKYLRELAMQAFNIYWRHHLPHLKPTAGYPQDARRFKRDIQAKQTELAIDDRILWRMR